MRAALLAALLAHIYIYIYISIYIYREKEIIWGLLYLLLYCLIYIYLYLYLYIYIYTHTHIHIYIYIIYNTIDIYNTIAWGRRGKQAFGWLRGWRSPRLCGLDQHLHLWRVWGVGHCQRRSGRRASRNKHTHTHTQHVHMHIHSYTSIHICHTCIFDESEASPELTGMR